MCPDAPELLFRLHLLDLRTQYEAQLGRLRRLEHAWERHTGVATLRDINDRVSDIVVANCVILQTCAEAVGEIARMTPPDDLV